MTACPLAPPIPELVMAIKGRDPDGSRLICCTTRKRYSSHLMAGFILLMLTFGGMRPVSIIERTLLKEAKKDTISE
jgi:hypothetical protein